MSHEHNNQVIIAEDGAYMTKCLNCENFNLYFGITHLIFNHKQLRQFLRTLMKVRAKDYYKMYDGKMKVVIGLSNNSKMQLCLLKTEVNLLASIVQRAILIETAHSIIKSN